jgi:hypothetical protein
MAGTATAPAAGLREIYQAALERVKARRNEWRSCSEAERRRAWVECRELPPRQDLNVPSLRPPETAADFFDDRICEWAGLRGDPVMPVLLAVADAARGGADAAVKAVRAARQLDVRAQWVACQNLSIWRQHGHAAKTGADRIVAAVLGEWSRLKLARTDPDEDD